MGPGVPPETARPARWGGCPVPDGGLPCPLLALGLLQGFLFPTARFRTGYAGASGPWWGGVLLLLILIRDIWRRVRYPAHRAKRQENQGFRGRVLRQVWFNGKLRPLVPAFKGERPRSR